MKFQVYWTFYNPAIDKTVEIPNSTLWEAGSWDEASRQLNQVKGPELAMGVKLIGRRLEIVQGKAVTQDIDGVTYDLVDDEEVT